jgi:hypothetical protein
VGKKNGNGQHKAVSSVSTAQALVDGDGLNAQKEDLVLLFWAGLKTAAMQRSSASDNAYIRINVHTVIEYYYSFVCHKP